MDDPTLFEGTAWYYARYRSAYPQAFFDHLADRYALDGSGCALDLGCGTGQIGIRLAPDFEHVVCIDPDRGMLDEARRGAASVNATNLEFILGSSGDLTPSMGPFRLVAMGDSFHWMDRDQVLRSLYGMAPRGGGVVLAWGSTETPDGCRAAVKGVIKRFLGERRRAGQIGFQFSTSYASRRLLGETLTRATQGQRPASHGFKSGGRRQEGSVRAHRARSAGNRAHRKFPARRPAPGV